MEILIIDRFGENRAVTCNQAPSVGDLISWHYKPYPRVTNILWYPIEKDVAEYDVIVTVE